MNPNVIPKSLHTVTVLVALAKLLKGQKPGRTDMDYVCSALELLGHAPEKDHHGLIQQTLKKM